MPFIGNTKRAMFATRNNTGAWITLGLCLTLLAPVECQRAPEVLRLIRVSYPESCSVSHVSDAFTLRYALQVYMQFYHGPRLANASTRLDSYIQVLYAYCNRLLAMKLASKDNVGALNVDYGQAIEMSEKVEQIMRDNSLYYMPESHFLRLVDQFIASQSASQSIGKEEALLHLKESATKLARLINDEMAPVLALALMAATIAAGRKEKGAQVSKSALTRNWEPIREHCLRIKRTSMDSAGQLKLEPYLAESEEEDELDLSEYQLENYGVKTGYERFHANHTHSGLAPLEAQLVQQVTAEEGYQRRFDQLANGL